MVFNDYRFSSKLKQLQVSKRRSTFGVNHERLNKVTSDVSTKLPVSILPKFALNQ